MLEIREEDIDQITELLYRILKGEIPGPLVLPDDYPDNEIRQVVEYANRFTAEYRAFADAIAALSRGELGADIPLGRMHIAQSFKNLHANFRHLTWKTQEIAGGDLTQHVDFMGDFSEAFNSMTQQLREAFEKIDQQNHELAVANHRMKRDLDAAARIQKELLPSNIPKIAGAHFAWTYRPCDELAGDSLNVFQLDDQHVGFYVLDVSGHGVPAALLSVTVTRSLSGHEGIFSLATMSGATLRDMSPANVAASLNALYPMESNGGHYFTLVYGILNTTTREFRYTCAGHPGPILVRPGQPAEQLDIPALPIGIMEDATYEDSVITLLPRDRLYVHSDGLNEEMDASHEEFGRERLREAAADNGNVSLQESIDLLIQQVIAWRGNENLGDDVSVLAVEIA